MTDPKRVARALVWIAALSFWVVFAVLVWIVQVATMDALLLSLLLAAVPFLSLAQLPLIAGAEIERMPAYRSSIVTLWLLGAACWFVGTRDGGAPAVGLVAIAPGAMIGWTVVLTAAGMGTIWLFRAVAIQLGVLESGLLGQLLPRTPKEKGAFALLSVAAGTGEELAFRGYAIPVLTPIVGASGAAVLTSLVFGILHGYQGWLGIPRTAVMGGFLAWGFLASGSLWPPILAHVLIDLLAGIVLGPRLLSPERVAGVHGHDSNAPVEG